MTDEDLDKLLVSLRLQKDAEGIELFMLQMEKEGHCSPLHAFREGLRYISKKRQEKKMATWMTTARFPSGLFATHLNPSSVPFPPRNYQS